MQDRIWDFVIIGAGLGGLMTAALIKARSPKTSVLILESHTDVGGCAGCFERRIELPGSNGKQHVRFDVGATTLSALGPGQSLHRLLSELGISMPATLADPGLRVVMNDGSVITRHADRRKWLEESERHFGSSPLALWNKLSSIERASWKLLVDYPRFPPADLADVLSLLRPSALSGLSALRNMQRPFDSMLEDLGLSEDLKLRQFLDQLLLVSTQTTSDHVSVIGAALGLIYPSQTYYLDGGAYTLSSELLKRYLALGGEIKFKRRVGSMDPKRIIVSTEKEQFSARKIISNATLWDTASMLPAGAVDHKYFHKWDDAKNGKDVWGANAMYAVVDDAVGESSLFHQLHDGEHSLFVSLSRRGDALKAPAGYRTMTVSVHEPDPTRWFNYSEDEYAVQKDALTASFMRTLSAKLEGFSAERCHFSLTSTPRSYEFYTKRHLGLVGGIAYEAGRMPWHWPSPVSPIPRMYLVGDTIFPGQSAGAVAQCALSLVSRL